MTVRGRREGRTLRALAPAKVNLCLFLGAQREDGRHELVTLLESISLADELTLRVLDRGRDDEVICPGVEGPNLVSEALAALRLRGWAGPPVRIEVRKRVPLAAGLGGGSADAAAALRLAAEIAPLERELIAKLAATLGTDVPSQLAPGVALGTGTGASVQPLEPLAPHAFVVLPHGSGVSTAEVYREADRLALPRSDPDLVGCRAALEAALGRERVLSRELLVNDLEPAALSLRPEIESALAAARDAGAERAMVCGSGPTVAGLYWGGDAESLAAAAAESLGRRYPGAVAAVPTHGAFGAPRPSSPSGTIRAGR